MKLKDILTLAGSVAGTAIATAVGGPGAGALVATALGAGGLTKKAGQAVEVATGRAVHKVASPLAAIAAPAALANVLPPEWMVQACDILDKVCDNPGVLWSLIGIVIYQFASGSGKVASRG